MKIPMGELTSLALCFSPSGHAHAPPKDPARSHPPHASGRIQAPSPRDEMTASMRAVWEGEDKFGSKKFRALNWLGFDGYEPRMEAIRPPPSSPSDLVVAPPATARPGLKALEARPIPLGECGLRRRADMARVRNGVVGGNHNVARKRRFPNARTRNACFAATVEGRARSAGGSTAYREDPAPRRFFRPRACRIPCLWPGRPCLSAARP